MTQLYSASEDRRTILAILSLLALSILIDGLDCTIVNVALPTMGKDFGISIADTSWIAVAYTVALASLTLPFTKIARNGWMKEFFIGGTILFVVSSAVCGISDNFLMFIIARLIQGASAAMMTSATPLMIIYLLPSDYKGRGMAVLGMFSGLAVVLGPSLGGIITSVASWHWIFFVNVPLGIILVALAAKVVPRTTNHREYPYPDAVNCILALLGICFTLTFLQNLVETSVSDTVLLICGAGGLVTLSSLAIRSHCRKETAIVPGAMLFRKDFALLCIAFTLTTVIISGTNYVIPFYLEFCEGHTVSEVGYLLSIASVFTIALSVPIGKWCDSHGCRIPSICAGVFRFVFTLIFAMTAPNMEFPVLVAGLAIMGISMACAGTGLSTAIIHHSEEKYQDDAATFLLVVNSVAASFGVALTSLVYTMNTGGSTDPGYILIGFQDSMWFFVGLAALATVIALAVRNIVPKKD